jgi:hypothetical protein
MVTFFRRIRQKFLAQNRFTRYLLYAVGEIFLVVVGILIALQINNWNELRKQETFEHEILLAFQKGLERDLADIKINIAQHQRGLAAGDSILAAIESQRQINLDTLSLWFSDFTIYTRFVYSTSAFETLKSKGVNIIRNDSLREMIIDVYDSQYNFFLDAEQTHMVLLEKGFQDLYPTRFKESYYFDLSRPGFPGHLEPMDFESLKNDQEFLYYIRSLRNRTMILIEFNYKAKLKQSVEGLLALLNKELEKHE